MHGTVTESSQTVVKRIGRIIFIPHKYSYCIIFFAENYFVPMEVLISSFKSKIPMALDFSSHMQKIRHLDAKLDITESDITKTEINVHILNIY